ncbi:MAG: class I SAM-dependent methyltransferase [Anaerolineae bacterium]|nr:class I SAM-dependent methyltransferase [Anaerolineae bacterium]
MIPPFHARTPRAQAEMGRWASVYDALAGVLLLGQEQAVRQKTVELAQVRPGDRLLDVGCGTGALTLVAWAQAGPTGEVYGIDAAPAMIDLARRKAAQANARVEFKIGAVEQIPFPDSYFDVVLNSFMIYNLPNDDLRRKGFAEMRRVLRPGGRLVVVDFELPAQPGLRRLATLLLGRRVVQTEGCTLSSMMAEAGLVEIKAGQIALEVVTFAHGKAAGAERAHI